MQATLEQPNTGADEKQLTTNDRCDYGCGAQAFVLVAGVDTDLMFCGHHYSVIEKNDKLFEKLVEFMIEVLDERHKIK